MNYIVTFVKREPLAYYKERFGNEWDFRNFFEMYGSNSAKYIAEECLDGTDAGKVITRARAKLIGNDWEFVKIREV